MTRATTAAVVGRVRRAVRRRDVAVVAVVVLVAALVGVGTGGTLALWRVSVTGTQRMPVGVTVFGAGAPGSPVFATTSTPLDASRNRGSVTYTIPAAATTTLYNNNSLSGGAVAIPLQVRSLAQGHRGLAYTLTVDTAGGVFGASQVSTYRVASAAACTTSLTGAGATLASTPWTSAYTASTTPSDEYWCLVARYGPTRWTHTDTAQVTATGPAGTVSGASSAWTSTAARTFVVAAEPVHTVTFTFTTFRTTP
ncbi:hypothetical protein ACT17Q_04055 [Cellulomonas sp. CW35]|uniref:hypothetical protein n=1 Tax=Cellulomonas sp. CW35 TaxID=3458249 RepID=UPI0040336132